MSLISKCLYILRIYKKRNNCYTFMCAFKKNPALMLLEEEQNNYKIKKKKTQNKNQYK